MKWTGHIVAIGDHPPERLVQSDGSERRLVLLGKSGNSLGRRTIR